MNCVTISFSINKPYDYSRRTACATIGVTTSTPSQIGGEDTAAPVADNGGAIARIENYI